MQKLARRTWVRIGGWSGLAAGASTLAVIVLALAAASLRASRGHEVLATVGLATRALAAIRTGALVGLVLGANAALKPASWVTNSGLGFGLVAVLFPAMTLAIASAIPPVGPVFRQISTLAPIPAGLWLLCLSAAAWRLRRFAVWLRIYGAAMGAFLFMLPAIPELLGLSVLLGAPLWFGLGVSLLRLAKSPLIPAEAGTQA